MELKSCANTHYIRAIRGGEVVRVLNIDPRGKPALVSKTLKDIYESEDAKRTGRSPRTNTRRIHSGSVKTEAPCFPTVDRTLRECSPHDGDGTKSDSDDDTTLKQLRERSQMKKRKSTHGHKKSDHASKEEKPLEDQSDLEELIINLKAKKPKSSKAKKKCITRSVASSSSSSLTVKSEKFDVSENSQGFGVVAPVVSVKIEFHEAGELEEHIKASLVDDSFLDDKEEPSCEDASNKDHTLDQDDDTEQPIVFATNDMSYSHLEESDPMSMLVLWHEMDDDLGPEKMDSDEYQNQHSVLVPWHGMNVDLETREFDSDEYQNSNPLAIEYVNETFVDQDPCFSSHMPEENISSGDQVLDISMGLPHEQDDSSSSHDQGYGSSQNSMLYLKSGETLVSLEHTTADKEQSSFCTLDGIKNNSSNNGGTHTEDSASPIIGAETQSGNKSQHFGIKSNSLNNGNTHMEDSASPITGVETQSSIKNQHFDNAETLSSPEPCPRPENLLLKKKVISPSSREQLRLAMNAKEHCSDVDQYSALKCKEKLFEKQTGKKASFFRSDNSSAKVTINGARGHFNHSNNVRHAIKKSQNDKGNYEGIRPRTLPKLTTACNSIKGCSENAIEFSQRQMHDMESIAVNLMNELNSMKEVVEQKLLFTAYRSVPLKNDADEVKSAIFRATKAEETARKWLTVMSRDCNRFCKIMKMTPQSGVESEETARSGTKKIVFADEVGGELCRVKNFKYGESSPMTDEVKQGLHAI